MSQAAGGTGFAQLTLSWDDEFYAMSHTLASGTPVSYRFTMQLDSAIETNISCDGRSPPGPAAASLVGNAGMIVDRACPELPDDRVLTTVIDTTIGARQLISGTLTLSTSVVSSRSALDVYAILDASHTGRFFLDPLGPDYFYRTASGQTYLTPAPGALPLFGAGMVAVLVRCRRRAAGSGPAWR